MTSVTINDSSFQASMKALVDAAKRPRAIFAAAGRAAANELKKHFRFKDRTEPNALGGKRTHYWLEVSRAVQAPVPTDTNCKIEVSHPSISQKVFGGKIVAKRAKALTIPLVPEAHGRRASVLESELGIKLFQLGQRGMGVLAANIGKGIQVFYALVKSVTQRRDATALPAENVIIPPVLRAAEAALARQTPGATTP